ncbi:hypothetical protein [Humibacillus xanthopallidus]|uniref:CdiA C-terminal domain-containing protein n=1 Tax=Humibacillus xanthopallidus TaxID=412689 RepID=UPI003850521C
MSRGRSPGSGGLPGSGTTALPTPPGDTGALRAAAVALRRAAHSAHTTATLRGRLATILPLVWTGSAAEAAVDESIELVRRCTSGLLHLPAAARALERHAALLEHSQHAVARLQRDWDRDVEQHHLAVAAVRLRVGSDPDAAGLIMRLTQEHEARLVRLSHQHAELRQELDRAANRTAAALAALNDETFPIGTRLTATTLRDRLIHGLPLASGAAAAADIGRVAGSDAQVLRRLLTVGPAEPATAHALRAFVRTAQDRGDDPRYAQALVETLGVNGLGRLVLALGDADVPVDVSRQAIGALGRLLLTAVAPGASAGHDAGTARRLDSTAALLRDDLVASLSRVVAADSTTSRASGYWLLGQLVIGARQSGWSARVPPSLLRRLTAGAAAAEIGETRDADAERVHGSTLAPAGGARFASLFDDADRTGDALHTLLLEAGDDPTAVVELLSSPVEGHGLTNSRGGPLVLAEALVRRWLTYESSSTSTHPDLALATNDDLSRLLAATVGLTGHDDAATLRARVMAEISRTNSLAQQEHSTILLYEGNSSVLESAAVDWVLDMPESIDATLAQPDAGAAVAWSTPVGDRHQPRLRLEELTGLIGALAVGAEPSRATGAGGSPSPAHQRLIEGEVARAVQQSTPGEGQGGLDDVTTRIGFFEQATSAALIEVARRRDVANRSMWRTLAEAKALALSWREGPQAVGLALATLASGGTNRSTQDDLVISLVRSNTELEQTRVDEQRTAAITARLDHLRSLGGGSDVPTTALLAAGARRAPTLPTSEQVAAARRQERLDALTSVISDREPQRVEAAAQPRPEAHELYTAERLRRAGFELEFLPRSNDAKSPDALIRGAPWEFKSPVGSGSGTVVQAVRFARDQSPRIVIDLARSPLSLEEALRQVDLAIRRYDRIDVVLVITRGGEIVERRP